MTWHKTSQTGLAYSNINSKHCAVNSRVNDWPAHHCIGLQRHQATFVRTTLKRRWVIRYCVLCVCCYAKTDISIVSSSAFMCQSSQNFPHYGDCLPWKFDGGLQQKILRESPKTWNFCTCTCKSAHCVYLGGQRSSSNVHLVGHCLTVPQPF